MRNAVHRKQLAAVVAYAMLERLPEAVQIQLAQQRRRGVPRIVVFYYGGTLGMHQDKNGNLVPTNDARELLKPLILKGLDKQVDVVWFQVYPRAIDSTNGRWVHWVSMGNAIKLLHDLVDGFVIAGGTDTMPYLLDAMQFMFPNIGKPIIATGAQLPMFHLGDDATRNLYFAILAACGDLSGAHLAFADVLRHGLRVFKVRDREFDAFASPPRYQLGHFDGELHLYENAPRRNPLVTGDRLTYDPRFRDGLIPLHMSPFSSARSIIHMSTDPDCHALLLITFGAGNVRDEGVYRGEMTHIDAMRRLHRQGFPVVLGSPMMDGRVDSPYASGAKAVSHEVGGISGGDTCGPALEVKMARAMALAWDDRRNRLNYHEFRAQMARNHVGELTVKHAA